MTGGADDALHLEAEALRGELASSLAGPEREISSRFFYDARGSELFERITRLPEYYLTRTERGLLERHAPDWVGRHGFRSFVELGAGSARKSEIILRAMDREEGRRRYVPVDVSGEFLRATARRLERDHPGLRVTPVVADMTDPLELPSDLPGPRLFALLGSTLGNFPGEDGVALLSRVTLAMAPVDVFLLGVDLRASPRKPVALLESAYDDPQGVTAEFNRNALRVLNRRAGTDFEPEAYAHRAHYDSTEGRIEMHLVSLRDQVVTIPGREPIRLAEGEAIRTEISVKYDRPGVEGLFARVGLTVEEWAEDPGGAYSLVLACPEG